MISGQNVRGQESMTYPLSRRWKHVISGPNVPGIGGLPSAKAEASMR